MNKFTKRGKTGKNGTSTLHCSNSFKIGVCRSQPHLLPLLHVTVPATRPNAQVPDPMSNVAIAQTLDIFSPVSPIVLVGWCHGLAKQNNNPIPVEPGQ